MCHNQTLIFILFLSIFRTSGMHWDFCQFKCGFSKLIDNICFNSDIKCGLLQCQNMTRQLYTYKHALTYGGSYVGTDTCHVVIFDFGLATQDPGLVPNGAECETGKVCLLFLSSLELMPPGLTEYYRIQFQVSIQPGPSNIVGLYLNQTLVNLQKSA